MLTSGILAKSAVSWPHAQLLWQGVTPRVLFFFFLTNTKVVTSLQHWCGPGAKTTVRDPTWAPWGKQSQKFIQQGSWPKLEFLPYRTLTNTFSRCFRPTSVIDPWPQLQAQPRQYSKAVHTAYQRLSNEKTTIEGFTSFCWKPCP